MLPLLDYIFIREGGGEILTVKSLMGSSSSLHEAKKPASSNIPAKERFLAICFMTLGFYYRPVSEAAHYIQSVRGNRRPVPGIRNTPAHRRTSYLNFGTF